MGRNNVFAGVDPAKRTGSVFCLHNLPAVTAGIDGGGQVENWRLIQATIDRGVGKPIAYVSFAALPVGKG